MVNTTVGEYGQQSIENHFIDGYRKNLICVQASLVICG